MKSSNGTVETTRQEDKEEGKESLVSSSTMPTRKEGNGVKKFSKKPMEEISQLMTQLKVESDDKRKSK